MEAQRYPSDYDGIVAGAPANAFTRIGAGFLFNQVALLSEPANYVPPAKYKAIEAAVLAACDALDGVSDGVIDDPTRCKFDPATLVCTGAETDACLTSAQAAVLRKIYQGPKNSKGDQLTPGFEIGGETGQGGWGLWISGSRPEASLQFYFGTQMYRNMVFKNPKWDYKTFDLDKDTRTADEKVGKILNALDPNLKPFAAHGGKLILYHGWCDAALPPANTIRYYRSVKAKMGDKKTAQFVRLFMLPGVQHCGGGPGPDNIWGAGQEPADAQHDLNLAVERWVEEGIAPEQIIASKLAGGKVVRSRPVCAYPKMARYTGSGSSDEATSFECVPSAARKGSI